MAELEAAIKGLNLAVKWGLQEIELCTDSVTVHSWLVSVVKDTHRPKVSGLSEMVIRRRLSLVAELIIEYKLLLTITRVPSSGNKADVLTRVSNKWLAKEKSESRMNLTVCAGDVECLEDSVREIHNMHHLGVTRSLFFARDALGANISRRLVKKVVADCETCRSIDPAPIQWEKGSLSVPDIWQRLAMDVVHVRGVPYLSLIDCGPSRFAIWRKLVRETGSAIVSHLDQIFRERGPPASVLTDNGPCFRSQEFASLLQRWLVTQLFSCAYRPSGNGIAERHHRTIKRMVARTGHPAEEMVHWFNNSPNDDGDVPMQMVHAYEVRLPTSKPYDPPCNDTEEGSARFNVGDMVFVKPRGNSCMSVWGRGRVTAVPSDLSVEVEGMPRHIADVRLAERPQQIEMIPESVPGSQQIEMSPESVP